MQNGQVIDPQQFLMEAKAARERGICVISGLVDDYATCIAAPVVARVTVVIVAGSWYGTRASAYVVRRFGGGWNQALACATFAAGASGRAFPFD